MYLQINEYIIFNSSCSYIEAEPDGLFEPGSVLADPGAVPVLLQVGFLRDVLAGGSYLAEESSSQKSY